ncbi:flavin-containing monooxygenase [Mycobacterium sp. NPDC003449]
MNQPPVAIVGAGAAGISVALSLQDRGVRSLLIDRAEQVASSWRDRYDRLKLNTGRQFSHLPGRPYPAGTPLFPARDEVVAHLEQGVYESGIEPRLGTRVERLDRDGVRWRLTTTSGEVVTRIVVIATGYEHTPKLPDWPGRFDGELIHSSAYRNPKPFADKRILVVGSGSSGLEIAHDLATGGAARVWLAIRTPPNIMPRPHEGAFSRAHRLDVAPTIVDPEVIDSIRRGSVEVVAGVVGFDGAAVALAGGAVVEPDAVICATGYRRGLEPLVGHLGVLDAAGVPVARGATPATGGLYFHGLVSRPALIGHVGRAARPLARRIAAELLVARPMPSP